MAILKATTVFDHISGLSEDRVSNTFHFSTAAAVDDDATLDAIQDAIEDFWVLSHNNAGGEMGSLSGFIGPEIARTAHLKIYDAEGAPPHFPVRDVDFAISAAMSANPLPGECAVVGSFQGAKVSGEDQARKRGRVFIGPLCTDASQTVSSVARPSSAIINSLGAALEHLRVDSEFTAAWSWVVYSKGARQRVLQPDGVSYRATGPLLDPTWSPITNWWVDNAFDTQRRRGKAATVKTTAIAGLILDAG